MKDNWDIKKGMEVLDMGTGTGILAIFASLRGAKKVMAVDINPYACQIAKKNVKLNHQDKKIKVIETDLFESVSGKFDRIIFNVPHWNRKLDNEIFLTYATYDKDYNMFKRFLSQAKRHLVIEGKILVGFRQQNEEDMKLFESHIDGEGYKIEKKIKLICKENDQCQRLLSIPGIGELTATAIVAAVPNANEFKNGRHMAAWLGLVPRQSSSGNKQILLGISKRGDRYLRTLLIHGARAALCRCKNTNNKYGEWLAHKKESLSLNKAAVALANKNARIIWSLLKTGDEFNSNQQKGAA